MHIPEYLLLSLIKAKLKTGQLLADELANRTLPIFLIGNVNSVPILTEIWSVNKELIISTITELYKFNPKKMPLTRVIDISQIIKNSLLDIVTTTKDVNFAIQLGLLSSKRDFLQFENFIVTLIQSQGDLFAKLLLTYINKSLIEPLEESDKNTIDKQLDQAMLSEEKLTIIFLNLKQLPEKQPNVLEEDTKELMDDTYNRLCKFSLPSFNPDQKNNDEIENKANEYFQQLYKGEKDVDDLVKIMKDFRMSQNSTEREIYA